MRKLVVVLTLVLGTIGLVGAAPASASNCTISHTAISWTGTLTYTHWASGCSDVDLVEFSPYYLGTGGLAVGIIDTSVSPVGVHYVGVPPTLSDVLCGRTGVAYADSCAWVGHVWSWCNPHVNHVVYDTSQFRIHSLANRSWGPWHGAASAPNEVITC